jgi:hypothetical protein
VINTLHQKPSTKMRYQQYCRIDCNIFVQHVPLGYVHVSEILPGFCRQLRTHTWCDSKIQKLISLFWLRILNWLLGRSFVSVLVCCNLHRTSRGSCLLINMNLFHQWTVLWEATMLCLQSNSRSAMQISYYVSSPFCYSFAICE